MAQDILYRLNYVYGGDGTSNDTRPTDNYDLNYNFGDKKALIKPAARYRGGLFAERHFLILSTSLREEPPRRGKPSKSGNKYSLPLGGKVLSECEANEGRSTFLIEILYRNFQSRDIACCFILSSFSIMKLPLDFQKFFVENIQKIKNGLRPSPPP